MKPDPLDDAMREIRKMKRAIIDLEILAEKVEREIKRKDAALTKAGVFLWNYYREQHKRMDGHIALALKLAAHEVDAVLSGAFSCCDSIEPGFHNDDCLEHKAFIKSKEAR